MVTRMHGAMRAAAAGPSPMSWRERFGPIPPAEALAFAYSTWLSACSTTSARSAVSTTGSATGSSSCCAPWTQNRTAESALWMDLHRSGARIRALSGGHRSHRTHLGLPGVCDDLPKRGASWPPTQQLPSSVVVGDEGGWLRLGGPMLHRDGTAADLLDDGKDLSDADAAAGADVLTSSRA